MKGLNQNVLEDESNDTLQDHEGSVLNSMSRRYFNALVENSAEGIAVLSAEKKLLYFSPASQRILGYNREDLAELDTAAIIHPDNKEYIKLKVQECIDKPGTAIENIVYRVRHKKGIWISLKATFTNFLHDKEVGGVVLNFRDITEENYLHNSQLQLLKELKERNAFIETILQNIPIGIAVNKIDSSKSTFMNKQFAKAYGWEEKDFNDVESFFKKVYPDEVYRANMTKKILADIGSGDAQRMVWNGISVTTNTGETRIINAKNIPLYSQNLMISTVEDVTGQTLNLAELERTKSDLEKIMGASLDMITSLNTDGIIVRISIACENILGYKQEELIGRELFDFIHPDDKAKTIEIAAGVMQGKSVTNFENRYIKKDGSVIYLSWSSKWDEKDKLRYGIARDVTEKKRNESALRRSEELLNKATSLARIGAWEVDLKTNLVLWSDITCEIHEVEVGFIPDIETATNFYLESDRDIIKKTMTEAAITGNPGDMELRITTAKGLVKWVRVIVEAEFDGGKCSRLFGSIQDIDKRRKAELAANDALQERNIILESIGDGFFAVNKNWEITYWNKVAGKMLGNPKRKVLNKKLWEVFNDSIAIEVYNRYYGAIETKRVMHFELYDNERLRWFEISAYPFSSGLAVFFKDITARKTTDKQFLDLNENLKGQARELAKSNAELEQFAYVASHDLQEPLRMVTSFLTQLENKYSNALDDRGKQYIQFAVDGSRRMRQIILDLLEFSRVGRANSDEDQIDINILVKEVMVLCRRQIDEKKAVINFESLPVVKTFKTPLRQVFQNLISNGLKYQRPGTNPVIDVLCEETDSYWQFEVKDNGLGIAKEYFEKIFELFQRLHNREEYSGTGIGLAIAKKIVENMGGKIWIESEVDRGTSFFFTIPKNKQI